MTGRRVSVAVIVTFCALSASAVPRTFVSAAAGSDTNPCSRANPCRNFAAAMAATDSGGEVIVLDSGGYGGMTITQAVSIIAPTGVYAGITVFAGDGVTVNVAGNVYLHGLTLNALGGGTGLRASAGKIIVERCSARGFTSSGFNGQTADGLLIRESVAFANAAGFLLEGRATVADSTSTSNGLGFTVASNSSATITNSVAANNSLEGFSACCDNARLQMSWCTSSNNGAEGVIAEGSSSAAFVGWSTITANAVGFAGVTGGSVSSTTNNFVAGNGSAVSGTYLTVPLN